MVISLVGKALRCGRLPKRTLNRRVVVKWPMIEGLYSTSQFVVELERGDKRALYTLMEKTIEIWEAQLSSAGL